MQFLKAPSVVTAAVLALISIVGTPSVGQAQEPETSAGPLLLESIDWYTGVAGRVDDAKAKELLLAAASDPQNSLAQMWIARVHSTGRMGFEHDEERARTIAARLIDEIRTLAGDGDVEATFLMGTAYDEGLGVDIDHPEAARWYRRAGARYHVLAVHNLGNMYRDGRGVPVRPDLAVSWWLRAAREGDAITQLRLGEAFEAGRGVTASPAEAMAWYGRAAALGNAAATGHVRRLERR